MNIEAMVYLLQQFNLEATCATSSNEAIKLVQNRLDRADLKVYSLILVDFSMPEINGFESA